MADDDGEDFRDRLLKGAGLTEDAFIQVTATLMSNHLRMMPASWRQRVIDLAIELAASPPTELSKKISASGDANAGAWFKQQIEPELNKKGS